MDGIQNLKEKKRAKQLVDKAERRFQSGSPNGAPKWDGWKL